MKKYKKVILSIACTVVSAVMLNDTAAVYKVVKNDSLYAQENVSDSIRSMSATQGPVINADITGGSGFTFPVFNNDESVTFSQVADDLRLFVKTAGDSQWIPIDNNAQSGWIYDQNFGHFWDGPGGFWFHVTKTTYVRLQSATDPSVFLDYTIIYEESVRNSYTLSASGDTVFEAGNDGSAGIPLPKIDGGFPVGSELDSFVYEIETSGGWVNFDDTESGLSYRSNGYSSSGPEGQWGYWTDTIYGLWFRPVTKDIKIRIGYPVNGKKGGNCENNYIVYTIKGNPDAPVPDPSLSDPVELGSLKDPQIDGWNLIWNDEFSGTEIDENRWSYETGYYLTDDPGTWGWGNNELEYYTDSSENSFVDDGKLTIRLIDKPASFIQDPDRTAPYSSGKLMSRGKFSFKYGRIDFCAKLPSGTGIWPALWMLPEDSKYGTWAASGEIDVMESKGRIRNTVYGTIHYGGTWPDNAYTGNEYTFAEGKTYDDGFHVYSCIWEKEMIKWYVDGECYSVVPYSQWYSKAAPENPYAPFDEEFYIIMNLAAGGNFDGGKVPDASSVPCDMQVEYVRVYQSATDDIGTFTDMSGAGKEDGKIDVSYLIKLKKWLLGISSESEGLDYDGNGRIDITDMIRAKAYFTGK